MRDATLCFLIKENDHGEIREICLAMKKRGFGVGKWNGIGGKVDDKTEEAIEQALIRETREEIFVEIKDFYKVAELIFLFPKAPEDKNWNQKVHVYFTKSWECKPKESEEMKPKWFSIEEIPFSSMWPDDIHWLPEVLKKKLVKANFVFGNNDTILEQDLKIVKGF